MRWGQLFTTTVHILNNCSHTGSSDMDWNRVEGKWKQIKGKVKEKWGNLTDDDL
jgi:CsbD-like